MAVLCPEWQAPSAIGAHMGQLVTDHKGHVWSCKRPSQEEVARALLSTTLILYGTHDPHKTMLGM
ncbi:hypothetical protein CRENBAI_010238 [Crenichthys baileyi]|uniref:Uncharacterized protein n=1 Tax=Crenichthys baileyi TaxID=28760 RepID=A0AAV9RK03_9TELE